MLPRVLVPLIPGVVGTAWEYVLLGVFKLVIFIAYLALILLLKDIRRLYRYHAFKFAIIIQSYEIWLQLFWSHIFRYCIFS